MTIVVAIDGPAASGKSTTARLAAQALNFVHLDTGAMYRAVTLDCLRRELPPTESPALEQQLGRLKIRFEPDGLKYQLVFLNGEDVTDDIRSPQVNARVSAYSALPMVRERLIVMQRDVGARNDVVCEGRDIGTRVFPDAQYKIFLIADLQVRAARRLAEMGASGYDADINDLVREIRERDREDTNRTHSPLKKADGAVDLDTSKMSIEQQVEFVIDLVKNS